MNRDPKRRLVTRGLAVLLAGGLALAAAGCSSIKVNTDWNPQYDFTRLQTWRWDDNSQMSTGNPAVDSDDLLAGRVEQAVTEVLTGKGYVKTNTSEGDFEVAWFLTVEPKTKVTTVNDYHGYGGPYRGWYGAGYGSSTTVVDSYSQGTLIIDVKDGKTGELVWRGSGSARLREKADPQKAQERARDAVSQILAKFPPPSPSS